MENWLQGFTSNDGKNTFFGAHFALQYWVLTVIPNCMDLNEKYVCKIVL